MIKQNNFNARTHFMFLEDNQWLCWGCGKNHANCGHHIFGRGRAEGCEKSPLNYAPMNNFECHLPRHGYWMTKEGKSGLLTKTIQFLAGRYKLNEIDHQFLEKYADEIRKLTIRL